MKTTQEQLFDAITKHSIYIRRYGTHVGNMLNEEIEALGDELYNIIVQDISRNEMRKRVARAIKSTFGEVDKKFQAEIIDFAEKDLVFFEKIMRAALPDAILMNGASVLNVRKAAKQSHLVNLGFLNKVVPGVSAKTMDTIDNIIVHGFDQSQATQQIARQIRGTRANKFRDGVLMTTRNSAMRLARTGVNTASNIASDAMYQANADIVKEVVWNSVLDGRTSNECISLDKNRYPIDSGRRPPAHINCRSQVIPVIYGLEHLERVRTSEKTTLRTKRNLAKLSTAERQRVRAQLIKTEVDISYGQWLKKQDRPFVEEVLGKGKADLFLSGKISVNNLVDANLRPLTLKELQDKYGG